MKWERKEVNTECMKEQDILGFPGERIEHASDLFHMKYRIPYFTWDVCYFVVVVMFIIV